MVETSKVFGCACVFPPDKIPVFFFIHFTFVFSKKKEKKQEKIASSLLLVPLEITLGKYTIRFVFKIVVVEC